MSGLFSDVRSSAIIKRFQERNVSLFAPADNPQNGVVLTNGGVAVGGQQYRLNGVADYGLNQGEVIQVINSGRPAAADYRAINVQRRVRDHVPYQQDPGLMVVEADGTPAVSNVMQIVVSNGTLTDNGGNSVTITTGGGGGGGEGELLYWLPGVLILGTQAMTLHNRTSKTLHISEIYVDMSDAPSGGGATLSVGDIGSITVGDGSNTAARLVNYNFASSGTITVVVTSVGGVNPGGNALIHLPYTYV